MPTTRQIIAKQVREAREKKGLTQAQVAEKAELTSNYYAMIERADPKANVSTDKLAKIAKALDTTFKI